LDGDAHLESARAGINRDFLSPLDSGESALVDDSRRNRQAEEIVADVERKIHGARDSAAGERRYGELFPTRIRTRTHTPWREIWNAIVHEHRRRSFLGFVLMSTQAFFYNAIFFTYALVLMRFYGVPEKTSAVIFCRSRLEMCSGRCCLGICSTRSGANK
jgi:hypothetical protein